MILSKTIAITCVGVLLAPTLAAAMQRVSVDVENAELFEKLAVIDEGTSYVDQIKLNRYRYLLEELDKKLAATDQEIADMSVVTVREVKKKGVDAKILNVLEAAWAMVEDSEPNTFKAAEVFALIATLGD